MKMRKTDQIVMLCMSIFILASILAVYITHHFLDQKKMRCRSYVNGLFSGMEHVRRGESLPNAILLEQLHDNIHKEGFVFSEEDSIGDYLVKEYQSAYSACKEVR